MKSDVITVDNRGNGYGDAVAQTRKVAEYQNMSADASLQLQLLAEEMLSMVHSVTGETEASFWLEVENTTYMLHLSTETVMDKQKRGLLIAESTNRKNSAVKGFLSSLRDKFEQAMLSEGGNDRGNLPIEVLTDIPNSMDDAEWDGFEGSVLKKLADDIRIGIRGNVVDMMVTKTFNK